jgi:protoporphyrinogen oxidase
MKGMAAVAPDATPRGANPTVPKRPRIVILGAGPTGLGAAWRLQELGHDDWELFEAQPHAGGLSASVISPRGFVWDLGVHVLHSHSPYFDKLLDELLPGQWLQHVREAWIWLRERFIPYPLQHNIWRLPEADQRACLEGLRAAAQARPDKPPEDFAQWILQHFGQGLADLFLFPHNRKVWACEPQEMGVQWVAERVARADPAEVLRNVLSKQDSTSWGPNATFRFPMHGGTGTLWTALFERLADWRRHVNKQAVRIRPAERIVEFADGTTATYDALVSTMPLDRLLGIVADPPQLKAAAAELRCSSLHVIGVALAGQTPEALKTKSWIYYPQPQIPFQRVTVFSNFAPQNVPEPPRQWSLLVEVSEPRDRPMDASQVIGRTMDALRETGVIPPQTPIVETFHRRLEYAYPTPLRGLDGVLQRTLPALENLGIFSRGRFGAWKYEVGNMDHCFMQGVEVADRLVLDAQEKTLRLHG